MSPSSEAQSTAAGGRVDEHASDALIGTVLLSKLRVVRRIGAGGAGVVYEVEHLITRHRRALKTLKSSSRDSPVQISRFLREAGIAGRLKSPRIVETFDAGRLADGTPYVLMELLEGRSLGGVLRDDGPLDPARAIRFGVEVCEALEAAHAAGVVHRDIKPENVFLLEGDGVEDRGHVKVLDFGVCKALDPSFDEIATLTSEGTSVGTPYFMAPEQIDGAEEVDARTDVYALGVTLYQLVSGELPFVAASAAALAVKIERGAHRPLDGFVTGVPRRLSRAIQRAMARRPEDRFQSVAELRAELVAIAEEPAEGAPRPASEAPREVPAADLAETSTALVRDAQRRKLGARGVVAIGIGVAAAIGATIALAPRLWESPSNGISPAREAAASGAGAAPPPASPSGDREARAAAAVNVGVAPASSSGDDATTSTQVVERRDREPPVAPPTRSSAAPGRSATPQPSAVAPTTASSPVTATPTAPPVASNPYGDFH